MEINVSFLKKNKSMEETIKSLNASSADGIHVDYMDNTLVKNKSLEIEEMHLELFQKPLEIHAMVKEPLKYLEKIKKYNIKYYIFHVEAVENPLEVIMKIVETGIRPGIAINPRTSLEILKPYLKYVDTILLMSVMPGEGGQSFLEATPRRLEVLKSWYSGRIEVDGGINIQTIDKVFLADAVVCGSFICMSDNYEERIQKLKKTLGTK